MRKIIIGIVICVLTGCQAIAYGTAADFNKLSNGMDKTQVEKLLGQPSTTAADADKNEETYTYRRMPNVVSWGPSDYIVVFRSGKVVRYGKQ